MSLGNFVKTIQNIMRGDSGINGDAQRIEQLTWILFLKIYDAKEDDWELFDDDYKSALPEKLRWRNWAVDDKSGSALTGDELLKFVNDELFPTLKNLPVTHETPKKKSVVREVFAEVNQYMKNGVLLRQVINVIDEVKLDTAKEKNFFGDIYETILKSLQSAGNAGEFYTPRAVTDFIVDRIAPEFGETVADFACGTGGFLTSTLNYLAKKENLSAEQREFYSNKAIFGIEKKPLPYLLAITNMLIHGVDTPNISHGNSLEHRITEYTDDEKFPVIVMNPPYGGTELPIIRNNFPADLRGNETADLFIALILYRLKFNGRAAVIIPDGFLFGTDSPKIELKKRLLNQFNLHTIIRLPQSVFSPYTSITTNILFFDNTRRTEKIWFYRVDMPDGYKHFSKTKPMLLDHFEDCVEWWSNRREIQDTDSETFKAKSFTVAEIVNRGYDLDLCGYPSTDEEIFSPTETIRDFQERRAALNSKINSRLEKLSALLQNIGGDEV